MIIFYVVITTLVLSKKYLVNVKCGVENSEKVMTINLHT